MNNPLDINQLYRRVLPLGGLLADADGKISFQVDDIITPYTINNKRLVLPTAEHQKRLVEGTTIIFHPMAENVVRAEDVVLTRYRQALNVRANHVLAVMLGTVLTVATSPKMQERATPEHLEILRKLAQVDPKLPERFFKISKQVKAGTSNCFINIYLKRGGTVGGKKWFRAAVVTSPFLEELEKNPTNVWGVKLNKKDADFIRTVFDYLLPAISVPETYNRGSSSANWPSFEALLKAMVGIAGSLNDAVRAFSQLSSDLSDLEYPSDWVDDVDNLETYTRAVLLVPAQNHDVEQPSGAAAPALPTPTPAAVPQPQQQYWGQPAPQQQPQPVRTSNGGLDPRALFGGGGQQPQQNNWGQAQNNWGQPAWGQPQLPSNLPPTRDPRAQVWGAPQPMTQVRI